MAQLTDVKYVTALDYASGTADREGAIIDMAGWGAIRVIVKFATIAASAVTSIKWQQDTDVAGGTMADLTGTGITVAADDDNQLFVSELVFPTERYVRVVVDKDATNATAECAIYELINPLSQPTATAVTDALTSERHISPAEGTA